MDDIDSDIKRAQIGKRDESLVNPHKKNEKSGSKPFELKPMNVNYHKYKRLETSSHLQRSQEPVVFESKGGYGLWFLGFVILFGIVTKILGLW